MNEKECNICIGIHHISTIIGCLSGIYYMLAGANKKGFFRKFGLLIFTASQLWASVKIVLDRMNNRSRLKESIRHIHSISDNPTEQREFLWTVAAFSAFFKILIPRI